MEVTFKLDRPSFGTAKTGFGINPISGTYRQISDPARRQSETSSLTDVLSLGGDSSTLVFASLKTDPIDPLLLRRFRRRDAGSFRESRTDSIGGTS